ncbi:MAG TPA: substrate-binding domain-containing protein [Acetobacteraceae bacterium]|jgi:ribose transport system substrate-binding protein|nr:substrate-binding domain-containing protein [Acetobacteraceae bacterium]
MPPMPLARRETLAGLALVSLASPARADTAPAPPRPITIAFVPIFGTDPFYMTMNRGARAAAKAVGATLIYQGPTEPSPVQQLQALNSAVARKPDVLLVAPADRTLMIAPLRKAAVELGIPVICVDTYIGANDGAYQTGRGEVDFPLSYIASDDAAGGALAARAMAKATNGAGPVYVSATWPDVATLVRRDLGFRAEMSRLFPSITVLPTQYTSMDPAKAAAQLHDMLARAPDLAGVYCINPGAAVGTSNALKQTGRSGTVKVVVVDATEQMVAALKAGQVDIIVSQHPAEMGWLATMFGFGVATGQSIPSRVETGFTMLDRSNIDEPGMKRFIYAR